VKRLARQVKAQIKVRKYLQKREVPEAAVDLDVFRRCRVLTLSPTISPNSSMGVGLSESVGCPEDLRMEAIDHDADHLFVHAKIMHQDLFSVFKAVRFYLNTCGNYHKLLQAVLPLLF
jgi:hypothetical protein